MSESKQIFYTILWIFLNIFSVLGLMGYQELIPSLKWEIDDNLIILWPVNWFLCHFVAFRIFRNISWGLGAVSYFLLMASTAIVVLFGELTIAFLLFDGLFDFYNPRTGLNGFFIPLIFFFVALVIFVKGGFMQIVRKLLDLMINFNEAFFEGLKANTINSALEKAQKEKNRKKK